MAAMRDGERLGRKNGKGFYLYKARGDKRRDPGLESFLSRHVRDASEPPGDAIVDRLVLAMVNEASLCLEEEVVETAEAVDVAMILGAGFPPFTGGLLRYADSRGTAEIVQVLETLAETAGDFFKPSGLIRRLSESGRGFYEE
jgi:3-hydroxyacyl-CoA dehydrogenase